MSGRIALGVGAAAAIVLLVAAFFAPLTVAAGWLLGFIVVANVALGSMALLMIHRLTGGRWGEGLRPLLAPAATAIPASVVLFVPVMMASPLLFPWVNGSHAVDAGVAALYLNVPLFIVRALLALVGLSLFVPALIQPAGSRLAAGLGLTFYGLSVSALGVDWIQSAELTFISTSFGAGLAFAEILSALAFAALFAPSLRSEGVVRDLGGLMLAAALGLTYLDFMAVLILWYGDLPYKVFWLVERRDLPWGPLALAAFILTSAVPIPVLMFSSVRKSATALRRIGAILLAGLGLYFAVLVGPAFGLATLVTDLLAVIAVAGLLSGITILFLVPLTLRRRAADA